MTMTNTATLRSGIMRSYAGRFVVDEDALRRLHTLLTKGATSLGVDTHVVFRIDREDDRFYETTDLADVLSDANLPDKRISSLSIELRRVTVNPQSKPWEVPWLVRVTFGWRKGFLGRSRSMFNEMAEITIVTEDRNWALLMADEIEPQIQRVMAKNRASWLAYPAVAVVFLAFAATSEVLKSPGIGPSVLFQPYNAWKLATLVASAFLLVYMFKNGPFGILIPERLMRAIGAESVFLWGE